MTRTNDFLSTHGEFKDRLTTFALGNFQGGCRCQGLSVCDEQESRARVEHP